MYWFRLFLLLIIHPVWFRELIRAQRVTGESDPAKLAVLLSERLGHNAMASHTSNPIVFDPQRPTQMAMTIYLLKHRIFPHTKAQK